MASKNYKTHLGYFLDTLNINGKVVTRPFSVEVKTKVGDVWTFTLSAAPPLTVIQPLIVLALAYFMLA